LSDPPKGIALKQGQLFEFDAICPHGYIVTWEQKVNLMADRADYPSIPQCDEHEEGIDIVT